MPDMEMTVQRDEIPPTAGLILAGGRSARMGCNKALLRFEGQLLVDRAADRLSRQVHTVAINTNEVLASNWGCSQLPDRMPGFQGPLAGVEVGLRWAGQKAMEWLLTVAVDTPFFPPDLCYQLHTARLQENTAVACASSAGRAHPTFALWHISLREPLAEYLGTGERRMLGFINKQRHSMHQFPVNEFDPFFNLNKVEDIALATLISKREHELQNA